MEGGIEKPLGIRLLRMSKDLIRCPLLHDSAFLHNGHCIGKRAHHPQIVGDENIGELVARLQTPEQFQHLFLNSGVERAGGLI